MSRPVRNDLVGIAAIIVALAAFASALFVALEGRFTPLELTAAALVLMALPFVLVGLAMAQCPGLATIGQAGAVVFAVGCVLTAVVVLYALVVEVDTPAALEADLGGLVSASQAALIPGGLAFAAASYVRGELPRWGCACFALGLLFLVPTLGAPGLWVGAVGVGALGLLGMGLSLLPSRSHARPLAPGA